MFRSCSSMKGCGFSFYFTFCFHFYGFSFLYAVDAFSSCSSSPRGAITQTELLCNTAGPRSRSQGLPSGAELHRRMEIALGTSSFAVWTEKFMVAFRDCKDHVDYLSQVDEGATSHFAQMLAHLPALPSWSVQLRGWPGQPASSGT